MANAKEVFDQRIPQAIAKHPDQAREIDAIYCVKISGDGGGVWTVDLKSNPPTCKPGESGVPECTIEMANEDFVPMMDNPQLGMQLYFQGKLRVEGDPMLATRMNKLFTLGE